MEYLNAPYSAASISPFQLIKKKATDQQVKPSLSALLHFLAPSGWTGFLALLVVGHLVYWGSLAMTFYFKNPGTTRWRSQLKTVSFCCFVLVCFMQEFFCGNLSTENVVVNTDQLLYSKEQVLNTKKEFCFPEKSSEIDLLKNVS